MADLNELPVEVLVCLYEEVGFEVTIEDGKIVDAR